MLQKYKGAPVLHHLRERYVLYDLDGCFVIVLTDTSLGRNKLIYDPAEKVAFQLTKENINRCCGECDDFRSTFTLYSVHKH